MSTENFTMLMELGNNVVDVVFYLGVMYVAVKSISGIIHSLISHAQSEL
jgi:hypothetical protein